MKKKLHEYSTVQNSSSTQDVSESKAARYLIKLKKADYEKLAIKFRTGHYIAKRNKSFRDFVDICKLDKAKGLDIGESYVNDKGAAVLVSNIALVTLQPVVNILG
ncbi:hypothetical protein DPMN_107444 [Dreissena polymorpha]|uniref:Uncharacterized protein n=1 Tax=Dreissena polymorpha TaxID=45954 RepID=A0A9D4K6Q8_DREPO|nr:hypothetical protein DPMN_107444 [Dreissena polymorpha]